MKRLAAFAALALAGCGHRPVVSTPPPQCSKLIPSSYAQPVEAAPVPEDDNRIAQWIGQPLTNAIVAAIAAPWASAYTAQDGQLEKANGRTADTIEIIRNCEALLTAARADKGK